MKYNWSLNINAWDYHCTASYVTGFWIPLKEHTLEGNHFCKVNPKVLGYFLIAVDLENKPNVNPFKCYELYQQIHSVLFNDSGVQL